MTFESSEHARIAALSRAAVTPGDEISAPARRKFLENFETRHECGECGVVVIPQDKPPAVRARMVQAAISAHFRRLKLKQTRASRHAREQQEIAATAGGQLDAELAQLDTAS